MSYGKKAFLLDNQLMSRRGMFFSIVFVGNQPESDNKVAL